MTRRVVSWMRAISSGLSTTGTRTGIRASGTWSTCADLHLQHIAIQEQDRAERRFVSRRRCIVSQHVKRENGVGKDDKTSWLAGEHPRKDCHHFPKQATEKG
jgi:hypothetical protein